MLRFIRGRTLIVSTLISLLASAPAAAALLDDGADDPTDEPAASEELQTGENDLFHYSFDPVKGELILDLMAPKTSAEDGDGDGDDGSGDPPASCIPDPDATGDDDPGSTDDPGTADEEPDLPEGCLVINVHGPNDQINHGSVVSNTVHELKGALAELGAEFDKPFGHYVREIARTDLGKRADDEDADDPGDDAADGADDPEDPDPKKDQHQTDDSDEPRRGNGSPAHSNAGGNGKGRNR